MRNREHFFLLIIILNIFISCKKENNFDVEYFEDYKIVIKKNSDSIFISNKTVFDLNDNLVRKYQVRYGLKNGLETSYFKSGNKEYEALYKNDSINGISKWYFDNSKNSIKAIYNYEKNKTLGNQLEFYQSGNLKRHLGTTPNNDVVYEVKYTEDEKISSEKGCYKLFGTLNVDDETKFKANAPIEFESHFANPKHVKFKYFYSITKDKNKPVWKNIKIVNSKAVCDTLISEIGNYKFQDKLEIKFIEKDSSIIEENMIKFNVY
jgi:antitoxin component YwqK of YwqJK toxin-antitoxin module